MGDSSVLEGVRAAAEELRQEHREIEDLLWRLERATEANDVVDVLELLVPRLKDHFAKEEYPGGLYDRLGATRHARADELRSLVDDHFRMLSAIRSVQLANDEQHREQTLAFARELLSWLADHERRERDLVVSVTKAL